MICERAEHRRLRQEKIVSEIFKMSAPTTTLSLHTHKTRLSTQEAQELDDAIPQACACVCERERAERLTERRERARREIDRAQRESAQRD